VAVTARCCRAMRLGIWVSALLVSSLWHGEASADDSPPWTPRRTVILQPPPEPDDNWVETEPPPRETPHPPQRAEQQEVAEPLQEAEEPPLSTLPNLVGVEGPPPGYHVERKLNYNLIVGGVLVASVGMALLVAAIADDLSVENMNGTDGSYAGGQFGASSKDVEVSRLATVGLLAGGAGATLIVLGVTTADKVYVPNRVASVSILPVVGRDRAGGALRLTF
jgi:hypothetical protein